MVSKQFLAVMLVRHVTLQRSSGCRHVVFSRADSTQREPRPPAGAICIPDKAIHQPHCRAQFRAPLQTAFGSSEQLYMYMSVMRAPLKASLRPVENQ